MTENETGRVRNAMKLYAKRSREADWRYTSGYTSLWIESFGPKTHHYHWPGLPFMKPVHFPKGSSNVQPADALSALIPMFSAAVFDGSIDDPNYQPAGLDLVCDWIEANCEANVYHSSAHAFSKAGARLRKWSHFLFEDSDEAARFQAELSTKIATANVVIHIC